MFKKLNIVIHYIMMYVFIALFLLCLLILYKMTPAKAPAAGAAKGDEYVVLGSMGCGWTRKQVDYMKKNSISHEFVDCDKEPERCKAAEVEAFPTLIHPNGEKTTGYKEV
jgi:uncharacterized membrane protein YqjE